MTKELTRINVNQVHIAAFASDKSHVTTKQAYTYHYKHEEKKTINQHEKTVYR